MRVALLQLGAIQKSRSANLQSLMAAIDGAASNDDELDLLVIPARALPGSVTTGVNRCGISS